MTNSNDEPQPESQVLFINKGCIDLRGVTTFGVCAKDPNHENPVGFFGTGLKYAIAICLREKQKVTLWGGLAKYEFTTRTEVIRDIEFQMVCMNGAPLAFTTDLGKSWELWQAYREFYCNAFDEEAPSVTALSENTNHDQALPLEDRTMFVIEGEAFKKIYDERDTIILETEPTFELDGVELHSGPHAGQWIFHRGIRVYKLAKPAMYNYNITRAVELTENRTLTNRYVLDFVVAGAIAKCSHTGLIQQMLEASARHFEATIDYDWDHIVPEGTFNAVMKEYIRSGYKGINVTARTMYHKHVPKIEAPEVIPFEELTLDQKEWFRAAVRFWVYLRIPIHLYPMRVAPKLEGDVISRHIEGTTYITVDCLELGARAIAAAVYKQFADMRYEDKGKNVTPTDFLVERIVTFGEKILGQPLNTGYV